MLDESFLRTLAREAIYADRLPSRQPDRTTWTGTGSGAVCAVCGEAVGPSQMGVEITLNRANMAQYFFHTICFSAWEFERVIVERDLPKPTD